MDISYLTDFYDEKIEKIKKINAPLNFIFYTDPHNGLSEWDCPKNPDYAPTDFDSAPVHIASMQYIIDRLPSLRCVVCGGDLGADYNDDPKLAHESIKETMEALYKLTIPVHCCIGNHDDCVMTSVLEPKKSFPKDENDIYKPHVSEYILYPEDLHKICMKNNPTDKNYYYTDFDDLGYRFVFLNSSDFKYGIDKDGNVIHPLDIGFSREQVWWFEEVVKTDKKVIVFSHSPINARGHFPDCLKAQIDIANSGWLWNVMQKSDNVIASIAGHLHYDNIVYDKRIVAIDTQCATGLHKGKWEISCPDREFGTITETAFDVVSVTNELIYCTRFGAGNDRVARIIRDISEQ